MNVVDRLRRDALGSRLLAPEWLRNAARPAPGPIPVERAVRSAIAVTVPVALGLAFGVLSLAVLVAIGALIGSTVDRDVPYRQRLPRIGGAILLGTAGWMIGRLVQAYTSVVVVVVVVAVVAVISSVLSGAGAVASVASLQLLLMTTISSGRTFPGPVWQPGLLYLAGGAWALALALVFGVGRRTVHERRSTAAAAEAVADQLAATLDGDREEAEAARARVTTALSEAYDTLLSARMRSSGRDRAFGRLFAILNATTLASEAATTLLRSGDGTSRAAVDALRAVAHAVRTGTEPPQRPRWDPASSTERGLRDAVEAVHDAAAGDAAALDAALDPSLEAVWRPPPPSERVLRLRERLAVGPAGRRAAARLVLCVTAAEIIAHIDSAQRSYWVVLTVVVVLKPDLASVFARGLQRGAGTVVGVVLGALVIEFVPVGPWMLPFIALFAAVAPIGISRNYGMFSTFLTPLVLILIDLISRLGSTLFVDRLIDSVIGVALVLLLGYVLWPESWHARLGTRVADTADGVGRYLRDGLGASTTERAVTRRRAYRALADLRTGFQQAMTEPGGVGRQAGAWWPVVVGLERATDALTRTVATVASGAPAPSRHDVAALADVVDDLAGAVREQRTPADLPIPRTPRPDPAGVSGIAAELRTLRALLHGPEEAADHDRHDSRTTAADRVVDEYGDPIAGALVTLTDARGVQVDRLSTDADGRVRLDAAPGTLLAVYTAAGHRPAARWTSTRLGGRTTVLPRHSAAARPGP